jgi:ribosomal-protein-alanine N-acetyltransferase
MHRGTPAPIETRSVLLRPFTSDDVRRIFELSQEYGMRTWMPNQVYRDEAHAASVLAFLMSHCHADVDLAISPYVLGIELKASRELVGHVGISPFDDDVEIGFAVAQSQQRRGIATEAVQALCGWALAMGRTRVLGIAALQNVASRKVLARAGFTLDTEKTMCFQGLDQPVAVYVCSSHAGSRRDR